MIFFESWESGKSNDLRMEAKSARFQELIHNEVKLKDAKTDQEVIRLDCGIKGRIDRNQVLFSILLNLEIRILEC